MHRKHMLVTIVFAFAIFGILATSAWGGANEIKARMAERLPVIMELKQKGLVGENNLGLLEFVGAAKEKADVVEAGTGGMKSTCFQWDSTASRTRSTDESLGTSKRRTLIGILGFPTSSV